MLRKEAKKWVFITLSKMYYRCHEAVSPGALLVLEQDIGIVVGHELAELFTRPVDKSFREAGGRQRPLTVIWHVLLVDQGRQLHRATPPDPAPPGATPISSSGQKGQQDY